jgi:hypothetical protein
LPQVPPGGLAVAEKEEFSFGGNNERNAIEWPSGLRIVRLRPVDQPIEDSQVYLNGNQISFKNELNE